MNSVSLGTKKCQNIQIFKLNYKNCENQGLIQSPLFRASVRAGGTGGLPPVDLEQRVAATRPDLQPLIKMRQENIRFGRGC